MSKLFRINVFPYGVEGGLAAETRPSVRAAKNRGARGCVEDFTVGSRIRLQRMIQQVSRADLPWWVTVTYHKNWDLSGEECKIQLDRLIKALRRWDSGSAGVWRLEYQSRGAPHYHFLCWEGERSWDVDTASEWWGRTWRRISGERGAAVERYGVRVERAASGRHVLLYMVGHAKKLDQSGGVGHVGRWWGAWNRAALGVGEPIATADLWPEEWDRFLDRCREHLESLRGRAGEPGKRYADYLATGRAEKIWLYVDEWTTRRWIDEILSARESEPF